ncbi:phospholipase/Carboxylesterase superfamily protein [Mytilinidion resinicola]|uniref:Phospholipase/Carboxylesterase superfamily protein n=1 Tax=Mytilinidion resinicola TaxID=574789 RepID=A0A6A6Z7N3_9PEZI|nr:phospholipase/Carboxylesterase superfamily protein [Mytilinidion resinicola]KAF2816275.1 phospholipase/Carboxylesterase superfamily protein [Mytilinidion resinicola]
MPGRLPKKDDFPATITLSITPPPPSNSPTNILLLLHGLGDTNASFTTLGQRLSLPETACISIQAPKPLPFDLGGFHWGDDIVFDQASGEMDVDTGFKSSTRLVLDDVIRKGLVEKCGYKPRDIVIFGFAQGAMVGLQVAAELIEDELGGLISIGGVIPSGAPLKALDKKSKTPVIVCKGSKNSAVTPSAITRMKDTFEFIEVKEWKKIGDGMPNNRDEMLPIMQFFARRLRSVKGVPAGSVEIT